MMVAQQAWATTAVILIALSGSLAQVPPSVSSPSAPTTATPVPALPTPPPTGPPEAEAPPPAFPTLPSDIPPPSITIPPTPPAVPGTTPPNETVITPPFTPPTTLPAVPGITPPNDTVTTPPFAPPTTPPTTPTNPTIPMEPLFPPLITRPAPSPRPGNFTTDYNGTNVTEPAVALLLNLNATSGKKHASGPCFDKGFYHLSCYNFTNYANSTNATSGTSGTNATNITLDNVIQAKSECLSDWAQTRIARNCNVSADLAGYNAFNCSVYFIYHFSALPCARSYHLLEKNNTNCTMYNSLQLATKQGNSSLRRPDYRCGGTL